MSSEPLRTGLVSSKCYASALADCDGGPVTLEHFVSKGLLERLGKEEAVVDGLPWIDEPRKLTTNIVSKMLCKRHNGKLSPAILRCASYLMLSRTGRPDAVWALLRLMAMPWSAGH